MLQLIVAQRLHDEDLTVECRRVRLLSVEVRHRLIDKDIWLFVNVLLLDG